LSKYLYCDQTVASNIAIPELLSADHEKVGLFFDLQALKKQIAHFRWSHHWFSPDGKKLLSYCLHDCKHWLQFLGLADFLISADAKKISCYPLSEVPEETIRHLLLDQVLPRCLAHQGKVLLHASAVRLEQGLLLFIGESGAGKSTLAGNFHQFGMPAVSDDCVWLRESKVEIEAVPTYGGLRFGKIRWKSCLARSKRPIRWRIIPPKSGCRSKRMISRRIAKGFLCWP
jgi:hypothetical protein